LLEEIGSTTFTGTCVPPGTITTVAASAIAGSINPTASATPKTLPRMIPPLVLGKTAMFIAKT
jgi:hypothetical protein